MTSDSEPSPSAHTKHGDLTLDQIAEAMPGMARLMVEISDRFWILYYAAQAGNWKLAQHEFGEMRKTMRTAAVMRPQYREPLEQFETEYLRPLDEALVAQEWGALEEAYRRAVDGTNEKHREFGYPYIEWRLPDAPPQHLRLTE